MDEKNNLYSLFNKYSYSELKDLFKNAKTKGEQDFYMMLSNFLLQKKQRKVIGE
ncbi:MAG: hypothetical protein ACLR02_13650 [Clostridium sp.]|jgi:hypothetical protein|nr:hypothetical protein [Clostridium sp.]